MINLPEIIIDTNTFLKEHNSLPALPSHLIELQQILHVENVSMSKIAELISNDPALAAQVLKIVNSAYFGIPREIADINLAVGFLGIHEIYRIAISFAVISSIDVKNEDLFQQIWSHSIYTALISRHLKTQYEPFLSEGELWIASMLHDIGKFVYLKFYPEHLKAAVTLAKQKGILYRQAEKLLGLPSHSLFGSILCDRWRLPGIVKKTILINSKINVDDLKRPQEEGAYSGLVMAANLMATLSIDHLTHDNKVLVTNAICSILGCDKEKFLMTMAEVYELRENVSNYACG